MNILDEKALQSSHQNYDNEIPVIERLFDDFTAVISAHMKEHLLPDDCTVKKEVGRFSKIPKRVTFTDRDGVLILEFSKEGAIKKSTLANSRIIGEICESGLFDCIVITYKGVNDHVDYNVSFSKKENTIASLNACRYVEGVYLTDYQLDLSIWE